MENKKTPKYLKFPNKKLRRLVRASGVDKDTVFLMTREEMIERLVRIDQQKREAYKAELESAKDNARGALGLDYSKVISFYKTMYDIDFLSANDYGNVVEFWDKLCPLLGTDMITDLHGVANMLREMFCPDADFSSYTDEDLKKFIDDQLHFVHVSVFTDKLKKCNTDVMKMDISHFNFDTAIPMFDSRNVIHNSSSEDGISRMLDEKGLSYIVVFLGGDADVDTQQGAMMAKDAKEKLFRHGFTDIYSGRHYRFAFQNPSSSRKANFMFVEAETHADVERLWCEIAGLPNMEAFKKAKLMNKEGKVIMAKLLARLSTRGSNSFNINVVAEPEWAEKIKNANVKYVPDVETYISRPYKTMVAPGCMEMVTPDPNDATKKNWRKITPGDGQMMGSFEFHALMAVALRIISENQYKRFAELWEKFGKDANAIPNTSEGNELRTIIMKIPGVFQIRHGEKKGICVRYNLEAVPELKDENGNQIDAIVPDSVRKFVAGEWNEFPLEICNWLKRKSEWVAMNPQFIQALAFDHPNALLPIAKYWMNVMRESLTDIAKAQKFHGIIKATDAEDDSSRNPELVQALRTCSDLVHDAQVCNWRKDQYDKFINDMKIGRVLVPGMYTYMICDPAYLLNQMFGLNLPHLVSNEYYFNGKECTCGMFRSPLIHPFEAQTVETVNHEAYWFYKDVMVFNGYDGVWDRMGGADFDGDTCAIVPDDDEFGFGQIIINGIRQYDYDIWEAGLSAKEVEFTFDNFVEHLVNSAKVDRTGIITNYASKALDISNHLVSAIQFAKTLNCSSITLFHPNQFNENFGTYGSTYQPVTMTMPDGTKTFAMKGYVEAKQGRLGVYFKDDEAFIGTFTFEDIQKKADYYLSLVEILRLLQGREIDGAKTGIYAEGISGEDFIEAVKVVFTPHQMIVRQHHLNRPVSEASALNEYTSLSPLARVHDYVQSEEHCILDHLANGQNFSFLLMTLLSDNEDAMLNGSYPLSDGSTTTLKDFVTLRKNYYNTAMHELYMSFKNGTRSEEEFGDDAKDMKDAERAFWMDVASKWQIPLEVIAVALYIVTYNKDSQQHARLTYGWLLSSELLSVFGRKNKKYELFRVSVKEINSAYVSNGFLFVNEKKYIAVNAEDGPVAIQVFDGKNFALLHKKAEVVAAPRATKAVSNQVYTLGTCGFKYHASGDKEGWKNLVRNNGFMFDITLDNDSRAVLSINGVSISALMMQNADFALLGKKVVVVNNDTCPIKETNASITDLRVLVVGEV